MHHNQRRMRLEYVARRDVGQHRLVLRLDVPALHKHTHNVAIVACRAVMDANACVAGTVEDELGKDVLRLVRGEHVNWRVWHACYWI